MQDFKNWCRIVCITVIFSGVLLSVVPDSKLNKSYKAFISLLVIFMLISPLSNKKSVELSSDILNRTADISEEELMIKNSNIILDCAENILDNRVNEILNKAKIDGYCKSHIKEKNNEAYIEKIDIYGSFNADEKNTVVSLLGDALGGDIEIEFIG